MREELRLEKEKARTLRFIYFIFVHLQIFNWFFYRQKQYINFCFYPGDKHDPMEGPTGRQEQGTAAGERSVRYFLS